MYDVQLLFEKINPLGLSHFLFFIYLSYGKIWMVYMNVSAIFTNLIPQYRCNVPPLDDRHLYPNLTELDILNYTTKYDDVQQKYDGCSRYGYNTSTCINGSLTCVDTKLPTIPCEHGYSFDSNVMKTTAVNKFGLVCDRLFFNSLSTSMHFFGMLVACFVFGNLSDNIGRQKAIIFGQLIFIGGLLLNTFTSNVIIYIISRFILAFGDHGSEVAITVYASELTTPKTRTIFYGMINGGNIIGLLLLSAIAYVWKTDFAVTFAAVLGTTPFVIAAFICGESPRWLLTKNKTTQAKQIINRMGRINGAKLTDEDFQDATNKQDGQELKIGKSKTFIDLFKSREMSRIVGLLILNWFGCVFVYYGIALNAGALSGDVFLNNTLNALMEAGAYLFVYFTMDRYGRRKILAYSHLIAGFALLISTTILLLFHSNPGLQQVARILGFAGKFGTSLCFGVIYQYTNELFPTELRSNGFGLCTTIARIGSLFAPFLIDLQQVYKWLPNTLFGIVAMIVGFSTFLLPDTMGVKLLESHDEAVYFYKNWKSIRNRKDEEKDETAVKFINNKVLEVKEDGEEKI